MHILVPKVEEQPGFVDLDPRNVQQWITKGEAFFYPQSAGQNGFDASVALAIDDANRSLERGTRYALLVKKKVYPTVDASTEFGIAWYTDPWIQANMPDMRVAKSLDGVRRMKYSAPSQMKGRNLAVIGCLRAS